MAEPDKKKVIRQYLETEVFFVGDFTVQNDSVDDSVAEAFENENLEAIETLKRINEEVKHCKLCEISQSRTNTVPGEGNCLARIVFVGEAPGADEDAQGRPFVGRAGQLLNKIINAMGLKRDDVFICNILKCRPPGNRDPKPQEIINCLAYLQKQLEVIDPEIIVALGAHAARTLLETNKPIGQLRGRFHDYYPSLISKSIKLMPTYHPAYLLRNYSHDNRLRVWEDMKKVLGEIGLKEPVKQKK